MRARPPFHSAAAELVDESAHPLEQLMILQEKVPDLESLGDGDAVIECRMKQLSLRRVLRHLYDAPLAPLILAEAALAEAYAAGGFLKQAREHLQAAREESSGGIVDEAQGRRLRAQLLASEGVVCLAEGRLDDAQRVLQQAAQAGREVFGEVDEHFARSKTLLGELAERRGRSAEALEHFVSAWQAYCELRGQEDAAALRAQLRVAEAQYMAGGQEQAVEIQQSAVSRLRKGNALPEVLVDSCTRLARWCERQGRDREALEELQAAERTVLENMGPEVPRAVDVKRDVALLHLKLGEHEAALQYLNDVHYLERRLHGSRSGNVARTLKALGTVHLVQRNSEDAERCLQQALRIFEADHPPNVAIIRDIHAKLENIAAAVAQG